MTPDQFQLGLLVASTAALLLLSVLLIAVLVAAWVWWNKNTHGTIDWTPNELQVHLHENRSKHDPGPGVDGSAH